MQPTQDRTAPQSGQAMIEFLVALVAVAVLVAGIVQFGLVSLRHTDTMRNARHDVGLQSIADGQTLSGPLYIRDRTAGADMYRYSRDDGYVAANPSDFSAGIVQNAHPQELYLYHPGNALSPLDNNPFPQLEFGLLRGKDNAQVPLLPVIRHLVYDAEAIDVETIVWMTWTKGIY